MSGERKFTGRFAAIKHRHLAVHEHNVVGRFGQGHQRFKAVGRAVEMVVQCSGNSRSKFSEAYPIDGTAWGQGGVANVRFSGVPLSAVLEKHRVKIDREAKFITAKGKDLPASLEMPDFEHSLPLADALRKSIFALTLNGEAQPRIHGGPVRLVTPGFYGTMHVKWLRRLRFEQSESTNFYHATEYRVPKVFLKPGEKFKFTLENSIPTWKIRLMSFIFDPQPGTYEVWSRSVDALGRSQPLDGTIYWNPNGYEWNGVHQIQVTVK